MLVSLAAGPAAAERIELDDPYYFIYRQSAFMLLAVVLMVGMSMLSTQWVRRVSAAIFLGAFLIMALVLFVGHESKGAQRWVRLGAFSLQPSEFIKPALMVMTAWLLAQREMFPKAPWIFIALGIYVATVGLLLLQPDVGQTILVSAGFFITFFVSGISLLWAAVFVGGGVLVGMGIYFTQAHVRHRLDSFFSPENADTYQNDTAREAIERGGLMGAGVGEGEIKHDLPDAHTDFIYSVISEEFGLVICLALIILFALITVRGILAASRHPDPYPRAAAAGLFAVFGLQAAINICVNVALLPNTGMTLPFISYGGSSLLGVALTLGWALALTRRRPEISMRRFINI